MTAMLDIAFGRTCVFCGLTQTRNVRIRRRAAEGPPEELTVALCARHRLLLQQAGEHGRLHRPTGVRWWYVSAGDETFTTAKEGSACPAGALLAATGSAE